MDYPCPHLVGTPGGRDLVDHLVRTGVPLPAALSLTCRDAHRLAEALRDADTLARLTRHLVAQVPTAPGPAPVRYTRASYRLAISMLAALTFFAACLAYLIAEHTVLL